MFIYGVFFWCHLPLSTNMPVFISLYVTILISNEVFGKRMCRKIPIKPL